ncbi:zinc finger protein Aiolos isoform X2 [Numida meleagris]|uniref:zinc finger protein Aiolos isoform X2 n=1 Tax=Numida meleagris TaxID=8996 RepID=UPI000B3DF34C|nr:zinc finger protein Aiolos isoform X2 [Numida meleagris]
MHSPGSPSLSHGVGVPPLGWLLWSSNSSTSAPSTPPEDTTPQPLLAAAPAAPGAPRVGGGSALLPRSVPPRSVPLSSHRAGPDAGGLGAAERSGAERSDRADSQSSMDLSNPQEQPKAAEGQEVLAECNPSKGQEAEGTDNAEELKEHSQSNGEAGDDVKVKNEYGDREEGALNSERMENPEESEIPYSYPREYSEYEGIKLERHLGSYDNARPASGKMTCDICGLACISLNVLMVHKRSHTVEKPYKCEFCGRSYKQRSSLEEHKERCRTYLQSSGGCEPANVEARHIKAEMGTERALVLDRLASNVAKRKSSMPQKFIGEKRHSFDVNYNSPFMYEKEGDIVQGRMMDQAINNAISFLGAEALRPLVQTPPAPTSEMVPVISTLYPIVLPRADLPNGSDDKSHVPLRERGLPSDRAPSPNNSGHDSTDTDSNHEERPNPPFPQGPGLPVPRNGLPALKDFPRPYDIIKPPALCPRDGFKVINKDGEAIGAYRCDHCRVLFLDYVMFTIHMGCHGFRDPFECNVCGYRSHDRYEFSSHIARGEHRMVLK